MADKKISELPASSALDTDDLIAVVEDGTTVKATVQQLLDLADTGSGLPEGYSVVDFIQASGSDQTATMTAAIDALPDTGGVVLVPGGTFYSQVLITDHSNVTFRGVGMDTTTIVTPTVSQMIQLNGTPTGNMTFEDMTFDLDKTYATGIALNPDHHNNTFRRCRFTNLGPPAGSAAGGYAIGLLGAVNTTIEDCEFDDAGTATGQAVFGAEALRGLRWIRSKVWFLQTGIVLDSTPHDDIDIDGGLFEGGWYLLPTRAGGYTNSGGTVTYTATTVVDSAASFGTIPTPYLADVRALVPLESGSSGVTFLYDYVDDPSATFIAAAVRAGDIVRTSGKWAVVSHVLSETRLHVEGWFDSTTYRPTTQPAAATAYTVYHVLIGPVSSNTATTITIDRWSSVFDGAVTAPAAGTLYEVLINHGGYTGIHAGASSPTATGGPRNIRIHGGAHFSRIWNDQISVYGRDARLTVEPSVLVDNGREVGVTSHGDRARIYGTFINNGGIGVWCGGEDCMINAFSSGSPWVNPSDAYLADFLVSGDRVRLTGSVAVASGVWSRYGFSVAGPSNLGDDVDDVDLTGTTASGYSVAEYLLFGDVGAGPQLIVGADLRDVSGTILENGTSGTVLPAKLHGLTTISSRWGVPGCDFGGGSAGSSMTLDVIWYEPFIVYSPITVTALGIDVISAVGGSTARLNIYTANSAWQPGTRLLSDTTTSTAATGLVQRSGLSLTLNPGMYLKAYTGSATVSIRATPMVGAEIGSNTDVWATHIDRISVAAAYAALPSSGTAWTTATAVTSVGVLHGVWMKWTS